MTRIPFPPTDSSPNPAPLLPQIGDSLFYDLPRMRLDGGARAFRRRWGYELTPPPTLVEEENEDDPYDLPPNHEEDNLSYTETRSLRDDYLFSSSQGKCRRCPSSLITAHISLHVVMCTPKLEC